MAPPADRRIHRELSAAQRVGWHMVDLVTALSNEGDALTVTMFGEVVVVSRSEEDGDLHAYRCLRRPRGEPQEIQCAVRYGLIFVRLLPVAQGIRSIGDLTTPTATSPKAFEAIPQ
ncbi:(2Fe-2S)-binding protein [Streptomyces sp. NPDC091292]|uniref:(2Fe-2S)-binding protein n=1 Tax=Streptomyces sp. NPDC091292 TaxID=3365991 RepID=UPI00380338E6